MPAHDDYRTTLAAMSDQAIRYQMEHGAAGGAQRAAILEEAAARGLTPRGLTPARYSSWQIEQQRRALRRAETADRYADVDTDTLELAAIAADYRAAMHADTHPQNDPHRIAAIAAAAAIRGELEKRRPAPPTRAAEYRPTASDRIREARERATLELEEDADWMEQVAPARAPDDDPRYVAAVDEVTLEAMRAAGLDVDDDPRAVDAVAALVELERTHAATVAALEELADLAVIFLARAARTAARRDQAAARGAITGTHNPRAMEEARRELKEADRALEIAREWSPTRRAILAKIAGRT